MEKVFYIETYKKIKLILRPMGNGVTEPLLALLDNNTYAVVKLYNNIQGNRIIFNEYICYKLAKLFHMPIPSAGFCILDETAKSEYNIIDYNNYGIGFYSEFHDKTTILNDGIIKKLVNLEDFYKLLIFDHLIYNKDRNVGNLLVKFTKKELNFLIIDHSHVFKNESIWDKNTLIQGINENDIYDTQILENNTCIYTMFFSNMNIHIDKIKKYILEFQNLLDYDIIKSLLDSIPSSLGITEEEKESLSKYLIYRLTNLNIICDLIKTKGRCY